jgi:hypothetical protein
LTVRSLSLSFPLEVGSLSFPFDAFTVSTFVPLADRSSPALIGVREVSRSPLEPPATFVCSRLLNLLKPTLLSPIRAEYSLPRSFVSTSLSLSFSTATEPRSALVPVCPVSMVGDRSTFSSRFSFSFDLTLTRSAAKTTALTSLVLLQTKLIRQSMLLGSKAWHSPFTHLATILILALSLPPTPQRYKRGA